MLCKIATVPVVPSQATEFVLSAASFAIVAQRFSNLSFNDIC